MTRKGQGKAQRFFERAMTLETDECIIWPFCIHEHGYGMLAVNNVPKGVHRLACERFHGPCPPGMQTRHGPCHTPACFNPRHLSWGTSSENARDRVRDGTHLVATQNLQSRNRWVEVVVEIS